MLMYLQSKIYNAGVKWNNENFSVLENSIYRFLTNKMGASWFEINGQHSEHVKNIQLLLT